MPTDFILRLQGERVTIIFKDGRPDEDVIFDQNTPDGWIIVNKGDDVIWYNKDNIDKIIKKKN